MSRIFVGIKAESFQLSSFLKTFSKQKFLITYPASLTCSVMSNGERYFFGVAVRLRVAASG